MAKWWHPPGSDRWRDNDWSQYNEVIAALRDQLGLTLDEARQEYHDVRGFVGVAPDLDDVADYVSEYYEEEYGGEVDDGFEDFEDDSYDYGDFVDDPWLYAGDEIELTATTEGGTPD